MKKLFAIILAAALLASLSVTVFAAEVKQDSDPKTADVELTTYIAPTYTVTIPADVKVAFNAESTDFGTVKVDAAQIDPDKCIKVSHDASGMLKNKIDEKKVIPYTVKADSEAFTSATYLRAGDHTDLTINISKEDWNKAYAGDYTDTVTFTVEYVEK